MSWSRTSALDGVPCGRTVARWEYRRGAQTLGFDVDVTVGKQFDVLGLKGADLGEFRDYPAFRARTAEPEDADLIRRCILFDRVYDTLRQPSRPPLRTRGALP